MNYRGKTAVITGAAQGIGKTVARQLAEKGASVALLDINAEQLHAVHSELCSQGYHAVPYIVDVSSSHQVNEAIANIEQQIGLINILVNVAATLSGNQQFWVSFSDDKPYG